MIHTSNLISPAGMVHSPVPGQPDGESSIPAGRPVARKSQIIEEEEDAEDIEEEIEEVDEFDGPEASGPAQPDEDAKSSALDPSPELEASPIRPPRSSSLRSPPTKATATIAAVTESTESAPADVTSTEHTGDEAAETATPNN